MSAVGAARDAAARWTVERFAGRPGFAGAYFAGSTTELAAEAELPASSDVDVTVVLDVDTVPPKPGKVPVDGVLVEVSYLPLSALADTASVATTYQLAPSFATDQIVADPTGRLAALRDAIAPHFAEPAAIRARCANALAKSHDRLTGLDLAAPWHELVNGWMFSVSLATHVVLVAALRNPTVRLRYLAARDVLRRHGEAAFYERLLTELGCAAVAADTVQDHLDTLSLAFAEAGAIGRTPFFFSADITPAARPVAIGGSQALIDAGDHREAVFWIMATFARCQQIFAADGTASMRAEWARRYAVAARGLLGLRDVDQLRWRRDSALARLPAVRDAAERIIAASAGPRGRA